MKILTMIFRKFKKCYRRLRRDFKLHKFLNLKIYRTWMFEVTYLFDVFQCTLYIPMFLYTHSKWFSGLATKYKHRYKKYFKRFI